MGARVRVRWDSDVNIADTQKRGWAMVLTHYYKKADEDGRERAHAELERAPLLYELAVLAPETLGTEAAIAGLAVTTRPAVAAWEVVTLVLVYATLAVRRQYQPLTATRHHSNILVFYISIQNNTISYRYSILSEIVKIR